MRVACLFVPLFPLAARLRSEPALASQSVVVTEGNGQAARVVAATRAARKAGVRPGMSLPQARALSPKLLARGRDPQVERSAQEALLEIAEGFSPRVEDAREGVVFLDVTGYGVALRARPEISEISETLASPGPIESPPPSVPEYALAHALATATRKAALHARVGLASSKLVARIAAAAATVRPYGPGDAAALGEYGQPLEATALDSSETSPSLRQDVSPRPSTRVRGTGSGIVSVPTGQEAKFMSPLPIDRLSPELEVAATLSRWGIRSIGDLALLPAAQVATRLGSLGERLHEAACGRDRQPLLPRHPPETFSEGLDLEWPLVSLEPFVALASQALDRLLQRLTSQALSCSLLTLDLRLDPSGHDIREHALPAPTSDARTLLTLLRLDLDRRPPGAPLTSFTLTARPDRPRRRQLTLFGPADISPDDLAPLLARLGNHAGAPQDVRRHNPSSFLVFPYEPPPPPPQRRPLRAGRGLLAVRVLRPPRPLEAIVSESPFRLLSIRTTDPSPPVSGSVQVAAGPWQMEEDWWSEAPLERAYWDIELSGGGLYRIYEDRRTCSWYLDGVYD